MLIRICMCTMCIYLVLKSKDGNVWIQAITFVLVRGRRKLNKWFICIFFFNFLFGSSSKRLDCAQFFANRKLHANENVCATSRIHHSMALSGLVTMIIEISNVQQNIKTATATAAAKKFKLFDTIP